VIVVRVIRMTMAALVGPVCIVAMKIATPIDVRVIVQYPNPNRFNTASPKIIKGVSDTGYNPAVTNLSTAMIKRRIFSGRANTTNDLRN